MAALLQMFQSSVNNKTGGVQEDALMAVGTLVEVLGDGFAKYMEAFKPFLLIGLKNIAEYQVRRSFCTLLDFSVIITTHNSVTIHLVAKFCYNVFVQFPGYDRILLLLKSFKLLMPPLTYTYMYSSRCAILRSVSSATYAAPSATA